MANGIVENININKQMDGKYFLILNLYRIFNLATDCYEIGLAAYNEEVKIFFENPKIFACDAKWEISGSCNASLREYVLDQKKLQKLGN